MIETLGRVLRDAAHLLDRFPALSPHWPADRTSGHVDKLIGESALLLLAAARVPADGLRRDVARLTAALIPHVHSVRSRAMLMRSRRNRHAVLLPHLVLSKLGYRDPVLDALLRDGADAAEGEVQGFRLAEREWLRALDVGDAPDMRRLTGESIFSRPLSVLEMDRGDLYAVTHWAAYATDLGQIAAPGPMIDAVIGLLDDAIAWQIGAEDLDLLGELLMMARMMRLPQSPATDAAWALIRAAWDEIGFLPSPSYRAADVDRLEGDAREAHTAAHVYHTMYVLGLLCATELRFPAREIRIAAIDRSHALDVAMAAANAVERAAPYHHGDFVPIAANSDRPEEGPPPFWRKLLGDSTDHAAVVAAADLVLAVRGYDLAAVARALDRWIWDGRPASGLFLDAITFLTRQQVADGAIGAQFLIDENRGSPAAAVVTGALADILARSAAHIRAGLACQKAAPQRRCMH